MYSWILSSALCSRRTPENLLTLVLTLKRESHHDWLGFLPSTEEKSLWAARGPTRGSAAGSDARRDARGPRGGRAGETSFSNNFSHRSVGGSPVFRTVCSTFPLWARSSGTIWLCSLPFAFESKLTPLPGQSLSSRTYSMHSYLVLSCFLKK